MVAVVDVDVAAAVVFSALAAVAGKGVSSLVAVRMTHDSNTFRLE